MKVCLLSDEGAGIVRLLVEGNITSVDFLDAGGKNPLEFVLGPSWASNRILLSLEKTNFLDSSAIGWLIDCQRKTHRAGGYLVVHSAPQRVSDLFGLLKLKTAFNLTENEAAARNCLMAQDMAR